MPSMTKPVVLVTSTTVSQQARNLLQDAGIDIAFMQGPITESALVAEFSRQAVAAVILRGPSPFTAAVFAAARHLKVIAKHGAGIDSVDLASATRHGVAVMVTTRVLLCDSPPESVTVAVTVCVPTTRLLFVIDAPVPR